MHRREKNSNLGPMLLFSKYFRQIFARKKLASFAQTTASFCKYFIATLVFEKKRQFSAKMRFFAQTTSSNSNYCYFSKN
jgi:hypothetical protein